MKKNFIIAALTLAFASMLLAQPLAQILSPVLAQEGRVENVEIFGAVPEPGAKAKDKGRDIIACIKGLYGFLTPPNGDFYEDVIDYWRDFSLWPSHQADVLNILMQTDKARYQVISAYLDCNLDRLKQLINAYYKLEAELYFVRHFVNTDSGWLNVVTETPGKRGEFLNQMMQSLISRSPLEAAEARALYSGYFDVFEAKYADRGKQYASFGNDPVIEELLKKVDDLVKTFESFGDLGAEFGELGEDIGDAAVEGATAIGNAATETWNNPVGALEDAGLAALNSFKVCPATGHPDECKNVYQLAKAGVEAVLGTNDTVKKFSEKKTFGDVQLVITQQKQKKTEDLDKGAMLARYELLYGQVAGSGVKSLMGRMDKLLAILGEGRPADQSALDADKKKAVPGSLKPLKQLEECADDTERSMCK